MDPIILISFIVLLTEFKETRLKFAHVQIRRRKNGGGVEFSAREKNFNNLSVVLFDGIIISTNGGRLIKSLIKRIRDKSNVMYIRYRLQNRNEFFDKYTYTELIEKAIKHRKASESVEKRYFPFA